LLVLEITGRISSDETIQCVILDKPSCHSK